MDANNHDGLPAAELVVIEFLPGRLPAPVGRL